jgi:hypothetical protein
MKMKRSAILAQLGLAVLLGGGAGLVLLHQAPPSTANAEERGLHIPLSYVHGISNWGPTDVRGTAVVWPLEGVAELSVQLLPRLSNGDSYAWWVMNSATGDVLRLGSFNTSDAGDAHVDTFLMGTLPPHSNMILITVSHPGDTVNRPGGVRSVGGYVVTPTTALPPTNGAGVKGSKTPGAKGGQVDKNGRPIAPFHVVALPRTGGGPDAAQQRK